MSNFSFKDNQKAWKKKFECIEGFDQSGQTEQKKVKSLGKSDK
jgi:hypothetical protein